jgi:hypothetical protein
MRENVTRRSAARAADRRVHDALQSRCHDCLRVSARYLTQSFHMSTKPRGSKKKPPRRLLVTRKASG